MIKNFKKYVLLASLGLSLSIAITGCGDSLEDTEIKWNDYYESHKEEAYKKIAWCFEEIGEDILKNTFEKAKNSKKEVGYVELETELLDNLQKAKGYQELNEINRRNCYSALFVIYDEEFKKEFSKK